MSLKIFLDSGPLGVLTNPKNPPETVDLLNWVSEMRAHRCEFIVPAIADYEIRRELERAGKVRSLLELDKWRSYYLPLSVSALDLAAKLWAQARKSGLPTADPREIDGDVLIASQALDLGLAGMDFIIATENIGHLARFVPADLWQNIKPR